MDFFLYGGEEGESALFGQDVLGDLFLPGFQDRVELRGGGGVALVEQLAVYDLAQGGEDRLVAGDGGVDELLQVVLVDLHHFTIVAFTSVHFPFVTVGIGLGHR